MPSISLKVDIAFDVIQCHSCGVRYGVDSEFRERLRQSHQTFYCPNGHGAHYPAKSDVEVLREKLAASEAALASEKKRKEWEAQRAAKAEQEAAAEREKHRKLKVRVSRGVCPCCKRTVSQLARHMETKHPEYDAAEPETGAAS